MASAKITRMRSLAVPIPWQIPRSQKPEKATKRSRASIIVQPSERSVNRFAAIASGFLIAVS